MAITLKAKQRDAIFTQIAAGFTTFGDLERTPLKPGRAAEGR
jgi:hypothetical protein